MHLIPRDEFNSHAPTGVRGQHPAEFLDRKLMIIYPDHRLPILVVNVAPNHASARRPLIRVLMILNLRRPKRNFHNDVLIFGGSAGSFPEPVVVEGLNNPILLREMHRSR